MPETVSEKEGRGVRLAILGCFALTFVATAIVSDSPMRDEVEQLIDKARGGTGDQSRALAAGLARDILQASAAGRDAIAARVVREQPPDVLMALFQELAKTPETRALAVRIIEMGAARYQEITIKVRAAREYSVGRFVEKDYPKAIRLYSDPLIRNLPGVIYYLGEIYLAQNNPGRDEERGRRLLREAAAHGVTIAAERLEELGERAVE